MFEPLGKSAVRRITVKLVIAGIMCGLTLTLLRDPRMAAIRELPLALIPQLGLGISGASHVIAFLLLWIERRVTSASDLATA